MGMNWLLEPTTNLPSRAAKKVSDFISPSNEVGSPFRGFMSGTVEGAGNVLSDMTSPLAIASYATGMAPLMRGFRGAQSLSKMAPTMDMIDSPVIRQVMPTMDDVGSLIGDMQRNMARIPKKAPMSGVSPSSLPADLVPRGAESIYNTARNIPRTAKNLEDLAYEVVRNPNKIKSSIGGDFNVAKMMSELNRARGR